ncbi:MAG TPA: aminomethyl-transferring glycine dehydrogenase subunit GcvPA [Steroidobacteraceae bacterium]|nr:aminomethyl-transferring glycine dehydrogenase subunit GcvPA [Steroidobacteraceae bacterium]
MPFIPHTESDIAEMLAAIGAASIDDLFDEIPPALRSRPLAAIPPAQSEMEIARLMQERAARDGRPLVFAGAGAYDHHVPAAIWQIVTRGEFYSAYTPYQAEASQGTLQVLYEFQTMMASLTGMQVSNASLYDGASALAEACLMSVRAHRRSKSARIVFAGAVNPVYCDVARAIAGNQSLTFEALEFDRRSGLAPADALERLSGQDVTALVIQQPNFFGLLEDVDALTEWAHRNGTLVIAVVNPTSLAILKPPGEWGGKGVDIVVGEGQPLGVPLASGGPYFGFMTTRMEHVRQMPGRIVGRTLDLDGKPGFTLTLQAREQHIRRTKATSNICTNQGLLVTAATVYLSLLGADGLERVAATSQQRLAELVEALRVLPGVKQRFDGPRFHEAVLELEVPVRPVLDALAVRGIIGGYDLSQHYPDLGHALLVCATETRTAADIDAYAKALADVMKAARAA